MINLRTFCCKVFNGAFDGLRYGTNLYGEFESPVTWTSEFWQYADTLVSIVNPILGETWSIMTFEERNSWSNLAKRNRTTNFAEFTRFNYKVLRDIYSGDYELFEPVKTPN